VRPEKVYAARVQGDSMIDEHICDGDIALIENRPEARDGEIVVALVDETYATLKRLLQAWCGSGAAAIQLSTGVDPSARAQRQGSGDFSAVFCVRQSKTRLY